MEERTRENKRETAEGRSRTKLRDVAELAGVSTGTASLVLSGRGGDRRISDETKRRINEAAAQLNYVPSLLHRSVRHGRTHILSFFNSFRNRESGDLYMDRVSAAVEHAGGKHRYNVLVHCHFEPTVQETYEFLDGGFADGLILFAPAHDDPLLPLLSKSALPTVIINPRGPEPVLSTVEDDAAHGTRLLAEALVAHGHRHIAIVTQDSPGWPDPQRRETMFRSCLAQFGVPEENIHTVAHVTSHPEEFDRTVAYFLKLAPRPTAIFVWNDRTAYDVLAACARAGLDVPGQISIVGYDGITWPNHTGQVVTSIRVSFEELADNAVRLLDQQISGRGGPSHIQVPGEGFPGNTLGPAISS